MQQKKESLSLGPTSDLVVAAKWLPGIIQADEPILPQSRLALTFGTIFELRRRVGEAIEFPVFSDPIDQLEQIHSFRFAAEEDGLRLAVTYDFGWEGYMRALWRDAGPFLDLLCCHCADYRLARSTQVHDWRIWIHAHERPSDYFYSATPLTVGDLAVLRQSERVQRDNPDAAASDRQLAGFSSRSMTDVAHENRRKFPAEAVRQGIKVIAIMYRLTRYWGTDVRHSAIPHDAITLIRATRSLIEDSFLQPGSLPPEQETKFQAELSWYRQPLVYPPPAAQQPPAPYEPANIQRGVLTAYDADGPHITHGAAVFLAVTKRDDARRSLATAVPLADEAKAPPADGIFRNLAFTFGGLGRIGEPAAVLESAPIAFRDGAAARAGRVGDVRGFHPSNWQPLKRNWVPDPHWTVELSDVDILVQLRTSAPGEPVAIDDPKHPLADEIERLAALPGLALLAVEALAPADPLDPNIDHLGFRDGLSQPRLTGPATQPWSDVVGPDVLLVGRGEAAVDRFWQDGSFLALRRMPIDRPRFDAVMRQDACPALGDRSLLAAKLLGRMPDGTPLATAYGPNNFVYDGDDTGDLCPLGAHVRRANPRRGTPPRIMRRGMSFGPPAGEPDGAERGSLFMAYCADLAEQYELILGWVNGGNSTRTGSYLADPLTGVPDFGARRTYRFLHAGDVHRLALPEAGRGFVGLSWSMYLFAPSLAVIRSLTAPAETPPDPSAAQIKQGRRIIRRLQQRKAGKKAWRALLNEPASRDSGRPQAVWAAIRADGGILDTPVGYLVGSYKLVMEVLLDDGRRFSNRGAGRRMERTIGPFHLGMDPYTKDYKKQSKPANAAIRAVGEQDAFALARAETIGLIRDILVHSPGARPTIDLVKDLIEPVLARLGTPWFAIPDTRHIEGGPQTWNAPPDRKPRFPGDFWSPSRYAFNPFRSQETDRLAVVHGKAILAAATEQIGAVGRRNLGGTVSAQMAAATKAFPEDADLARVLIGAMIGAVPTIAGNAVRLLVAGLEGGDLTRAQPVWLAIDPEDRTYAQAAAHFGAALGQGLQDAPVPEMLWRVVAGHGIALGGTVLEKDRSLIFSLESAGLDRAAQGKADTWIPFGMAPPGEQQPAHGCPGRAMAIGAMLGLLAGFLEAARFRPAGRALAELWPLG